MASVSSCLCFWKTSNKKVTEVALALKCALEPFSLHAFDTRGCWLGHERLWLTGSGIIFFGFVNAERRGAPFRESREGHGDDKVEATRVSRPLQRRLLQGVLALPR